MLTKCLKRMVIPRAIYACSKVNIPPKVHAVVEDNSASYTLDDAVPGAF